MSIRFLSTMLVAAFCFVTSAAQAAPYAAIVLDARDGSVLHSRSADTPLHPASLTKMMTLYLAFEAVESGQLGIDQQIRISRNAASEPPSRLGLSAGQRISVRYLIRAAAVRSANDAATALGEAIAGSEQAFAQLMTDTARSLGMTNTTFRNANGLTATGHLSTARDMSMLARHLFFDYPQYYNIFGRTSTSAGVATVQNTNRRLLNGYSGADGIKTGYTRAAGYNLAASAERGGERIIAVIFGGSSSNWRYNRMVELLDMGFERAPSRVATIRPQREEAGAVLASIRPMPRGVSEPTQLVAAASLVGNALVSSAAAAVRDEPTASTVPLTITASGSGAPMSAPRPLARPGGEWAVQLGAYRDPEFAESVLTDALLGVTEPLVGAHRSVGSTVVNGVPLYAATFIGLSEQQASATCSSLHAQDRICRLVEPNG
ncbi:D-alanyl-D-alanine carboxypeptidase [Monaibacterium marinum]|uniref:D-alanyl-D-alanine carboxypeptidase n=1 Tax=Pontivivens marinum TaxID=1690039 RepID=A0A2C9CSJ3_9RHOB|nr:D-alanyl-D-alanine carboxypeptidase family protein [Monaibacterium marinum]SOH94222.1 D-alanyl-D-alanine carboxypeptidase [Monaibacterium marinum]